MDASTQQNAENFTLNLPSHLPHPPADTELTNLNWVSGVPVPMQNPLSPTRKARSQQHHQQQREEYTAQLVPGEGDFIDSSSGSKDRANKRSSSNKRGDDRTVEEITEGQKEEDSRTKKPNCSYTSLIGLALMASQDGCLPVSEIYTYIEDKFPYFKSAPDGWKNSVRHNLSLNPAFRKVKDSLRWQEKKGYYWEVVPEKRVNVEREVERYLQQEGKLKEHDTTELEVYPFPSCLQASIPSMPGAQTPNPPPICSFQFCTGTQPYYDIVSSMLRYYPLPRSPFSLPHVITDDNAHEIPVATTLTLFDMELSPSQFAGFPDPASCPAHSTLTDLFGLQPLPTPPTPDTHTLPEHTTTDISVQDPLPCRETGIPLPDGSSDMRMQTLRKRALDLLTMPKADHCSCCDDDAESDPYFDQSFMMNALEDWLVDGNPDDDDDDDVNSCEELGRQRDEGFARKTL